MKNETTAQLTLTNFKYVDRLGQTRSLNVEWKLKPGFYGYLTHGAGQNKVIAKKIMYDVTTTDGKTVNWSASSIGLDADGDFYSRFTNENFTTHLKLLGKTRVQVRKPVAGPTDEDIARGAIKALGAAALHEITKQRPADIIEAIAIEAARTGRDKLIKSAIDDLFPQVEVKDRTTLGHLVPLALDGRLTDRNLRDAQARDAIVNHLKKKNPDFAFAVQAADFLIKVQEGSR